MRRSVTIRRTADTGVVSVRSGDKVLGTVARLEGETGDVMTGAFTHRPAFADFAEAFRNLGRAIDQGDAPAADAIRADLEAQDVVVWHAQHEMRIDEPRSLRIADGCVRFRPTGAFVMMRTGGL